MLKVWILTVLFYAPHTSSTNSIGIGAATTYTYKTLEECQQGSSFWKKNEPYVRQMYCTPAYK
jgi:hypothetical protein